MSSQDMVVAGSSVTARQMKEFWKQCANGDITSEFFQGFLDRKLTAPPSRLVSFTPPIWIKVYKALGLAFDQSLWANPTPGFWDVYVQPGVTPNRVVATMRQLGIEIWTYVDDLDANVRDLVVTPTPYRRRFRANVDADSDLANKSADMLEQENVPCITLAERLLLGLAYYLATGNETDIHKRHLDPDTITLCARSRDSDGGVPDVYWHRGDRGVYVHWYGAGHRFLRLRSRLAVT